MLDSVEEPVQVDVDDPGQPILDGPPGRFHGLMGAPTGPEAEAAVREGGLEERAEDLAQRLLEEAVEHRGHAQLPDPATGLRDGHPADGTGAVRVLVERAADVRPGGSQMRP